MKSTITDFGAYTEKRWEPDEAPKSNGSAGNGHAGDAIAVEAWPILDRAAYHGLAGQVVATILPHTESDPAALLLQYLVSFGNAVGRHPHYLVEGAEHYPVLYALLAGPTAKARKGTSAQHVRRVIAIADPDWTSGSVASGISSGEGIIHAIRDPTFSLNKKGELAMTDAGVEDKRLLLDEREFSAALDSMKREGNVVSRIVRDAWDCPAVLRTLTKHSPTRVTRPHISIIGHITIDELQQKLDQTSLANGFANRFLYACVRRSKLLPHGGTMDSGALNLVGVATLEALTTARNIERVTMAPEAARLWEDVYPRMSEGVPGLLGTVIARAEAQAIRLALLYALLDQARTIERVHLDAALKMWAYCEASARHIFADFSGDPVADAILRALRLAGTDGASRKDIYRLFGGHMLANKIERALGKLLVDGKIRRHMQPGAGRGRPTEMWFAI